MPFEPTPGPWKPASQGYRNLQTGTVGQHWWIVDANGNAIPMDERASPHAESNARLLAEAWTMFEALEVIADEAGGTIGGYAKTVLAKVTGEPIEEEGK